MRTRSGGGAGKSQFVFALVLSGAVALPPAHAECCPADLDFDEFVGTTDFLIFMGNWHEVGSPVGDLDGDGFVGTTDFLQLVAAWGPCLDPEPELMHVGWLSPDMSAWAHQRGWTPIPLMTHRFHFNDRDDRFDGQKYSERIWWPEWEPGGMTPGAVTPETMWERFGIPDDDAPGTYGGWVDLDFERYGPVRYPNSHDPDEVLRIFDSYVDLAAATNELRPNTKTILHGLVNNQGSAEGQILIESIVTHYDAISPSIYPRFKEGFPDLQQQITSLRIRLAFCCYLRDVYGVKLYPVVWKRYFPTDHGEINPLSDPDDPQPFRIVMPDPIARAILDTVLDHNPDGLIVFGPDGKNHYRVEPNWPPDTPDGPTVDATTQAWLELIEQLIAENAGG